MQGFPYVGSALCVQPEIGGVAKDSSQDQGGICRYCATVTAQLIDVLSWQTRLFRQLRLGEVQWFHKFFY
jgi:hypothetical protein